MKNGRNEIDEKYFAIQNPMTLDLKWTKKLWKDMQTARQNADCDNMMMSLTSVQIKSDY